MRLLLIEDDAMVGRALHAALAASGFAADWVRDGRAGELALANGGYDAVLLDLGLPVKDGIVLLRQLRARGDRVPVLVLSARDSLPDRVLGLDTGADDYLLKPFELDELVARLRALIRRSAGGATPVFTAGGVTLDPVLHSVAVDGQAVEVTAREFALLEALARRPGAVISRQRLEECVYGWGEEVASNAVEVHLSHLRRKLGAGRIVNVRGMGYRLAEA
jgi:two-component system, OmpR family, response regulator QseB